MSSRKRQERQRMSVSEPLEIQRTHCICCGQRFSDDTIWSEAGWIESQVSGLCEACIDLIADVPAPPERASRTDDDIPLDEGNHHA